MNIIDIRHQLNFVRSVRINTVGVILHHTAGGEAGLIPTAQRTGHFYHYAIRPNGEILYLLDHERIAFHAATNLTLLARTELDTVLTGTDRVNRGTIGVAFIGNFSNNPPTNAAIESCVQLLTWLKTIYPHIQHRIYGHRDVTATVCPGRVPVAEIRALVLQRKEVLTSPTVDIEGNEFSNIDTSGECGCVQPTVYTSLQDVPSWGRDTIEKLVELNIIQGVSAGILNITNDKLRLLVIMRRCFESVTEIKEGSNLWNSMTLFLG